MLDLTIANILFWYNKGKKTKQKFMTTKILARCVIAPDIDRMDEKLRYIIETRK